MTKIIQTMMDAITHRQAADARRTRRGGSYNEVSTSTAILVESLMYRPF